MSSPQFMPLYIGDYLRDTQRLLVDQHGAYLLLLMYCWQHGAIPIDSPQALAHIVGTNTRRWNRELAPTVLPFFRTDGTHTRVEIELHRAKVLSEKRRLFGRRGGRRSAETRRENAVFVGAARR